jgi:hypothetical protein
MSLGKAKKEEEHHGAWYLVSFQGETLDIDILAQKTTAATETHKTRRYYLQHRVFTVLIAPRSHIPDSFQILFGFYPQAISRVSSPLPAQGCSSSSSSLSLLNRPGMSEPAGNDSSFIIQLDQLS